MKFNKEILDEKAVTLIGDMADLLIKYGKMANNKPSKNRSTQERSLRGALKHISKYGKDTVLHHFLVDSFIDNDMWYCVHQNLDGTWDCDCEDYRRYRGLNPNYACKHIKYVMGHADYQLDISYGQGAVEAHRRLTSIASKALEEE